MTCDARISFLLINLSFLLAWRCFILLLYWSCRHSHFPSSSFHVNFVSATNSTRLNNIRLLSLFYESRKWLGNNLDLACLFAIFSSSVCNFLYTSKSTVQGGKSGNELATEPTNWNREAFPFTFGRVSLKNEWIFRLTFSSIGIYKTKCLSEHDCKKEKEKLNWHSDYCCMSNKRRNSKKLRFIHHY